MEEDLKKTIEEKKKELDELQYKLKTQEEEKVRKQKAFKYFKDNFGLSYVHEDNDERFYETYNEAKREFIKGFTDDESFNKYNIKELREKYIKEMKGDVKFLQDILDKIIKENKGMEDEKVR